MSAFGYFGSKLRIARKLCDNLPRHNAWVELFCGSAAMTLAKPIAPIEIINDLNGDIINFFEQLRDNGEKLLKQIRLTPYSRKEFEISRESYIDLSDMERARRFFVSAMMAINGSFGDSPGGFSLSNSYARGWMEARVSRWLQMPNYLDTVVSRLQRVRIENKDGIELFKDFKNRPGTLVYCDPPYLARRTRGYDIDQNTTEFHERLLNELVEAKCMVFVSGYDNPLYQRFLKEEAGWSNLVIDAVTKGNNGKSFVRKEVVWFNSVYTKVQESGRLPLRLSKQEFKNKKLNPER